MPRGRKSNAEKAKANLESLSQAQKPFVDELSTLQGMCMVFEKLGEDERKRAFDFFTHKYSKYSSKL